MATAGGLEYPVPPAVVVTAVTAPPGDITATADAPLPPPPWIVTGGGVTYPLPPAVTLMLLTALPEIAAVA
jgi:hypothetical protein